MTSPRCAIGACACLRIAGVAFASPIWSLLGTQAAWKFLASTIGYASPGYLSRVAVAPPKQVSALATSMPILTG